MNHEHLSDEQLSAFIDGRAPDESASAGPDVHASISSCAGCRRRLAALEEARDLVRLPVPAVPASAKHAAVRAALTDAGTSEVAGTETASVAPMASARRASRRSRLSLGAAAAVVALALAAGIPAALSHSSSSPTSSAAHAIARPHRSAPSPAASEAPTAKGSNGTTSASATGATGATGVPDFGTISSPSSLRSRLAPAVKSGRYNGEFSGAGLSATPQNDSVQAAPLAAPAGLPAPFAPCVAAARKHAGQDHPVALVATITYDRTPALVVVVTVAASPTGSAPTTHLAVVVARSGCRTLTTTTF